MTLLILPLAIEMELEQVLAVGMEFVGGAADREEDREDEYAYPCLRAAMRTELDGDKDADAEEEDVDDKLGLDCGESLYLLVVVNLSLSRSGRGRDSGGAGREERAADLDVRLVAGT
jgi:hypothetical protein